MNAERLLSHYEQIADVPDAIARLRRFILDQAVRGKLVPQDPRDEPASELVKRIEREKAWLVKVGEIKTRDASLEIKEIENSFEIPSGWRCVTLGSLLILMKNGLNVKPNKTEGKYKVTRIETISFENIDLRRVGFVDELSDALIKQHLIKKGDILFSHINSEPHLGKTAISIVDDSTLIHGVNLLLLRASQNIDANYFNLVVRQLRACGYFVSIAQRAVNQSSINQKNLGKAPIPLPPLAEQHRIVAKVDELMGLCDELEAARAEREATRDRLTVSSLARLNAPDPETLQDDVSFVLNAIPVLTTRPDQIKQLRQTILNLAVRGKLVLQDPNDEPAAELLKRIARERERLLKIGEIKEAKRIGVTKDTVVAVPAGWQIVPLAEVINSHLGGGTPSKNNHAYWGGNILWASVKDVGKKKYLDDTIDRITEEGLVNSSSNLVPEGNLIVVTRMGLGQLSINRVPVAINQDLRALFLSRYLNIDYVYNFFLTYGMEGAGMTVKGIKLEELLGIPFPLPPLAEQHRIVAKVYELMGLCDQLEASLTDTAATRSRLLDSLLAETVEPA